MLSLQEGSFLYLDSLHPACLSGSLQGTYQSHIARYHPDPWLSYMARTTRKQPRKTSSPRVGYCWPKCGRNPTLLANSRQMAAAAVHENALDTSTSESEVSSTFFRPLQKAPAQVLGLGRPRKFTDAQICPNGKGSRK